MWPDNKQTKSISNVPSNLSKSIAKRDNKKIFFFKSNLVFL